MKVETYKFVEMLQVLTSEEGLKRLREVGIHQANGSLNFIDQVVIEEQMLYARSNADETWLMIPLNQIVGVQAEFDRHHAGSWFKDAPTLPAAIAKLKTEIAKRSA